MRINDHRNLEVRYPEPVDRKQVEDFMKNVAKPADEKAGYKMVRFTWVHTGGPMNMGIFIGELDSLADLERVDTVKEIQETGAEFGRRFPDTEATRRILQVIEWSGRASHGIDLLLQEWQRKRGPARLARIKLDDLTDRAGRVKKKGEEEMRYKKLLAIILLSLSSCFVSGAGYGKVQ